MILLEYFSHGLNWISVENQTLLLLVLHQVVTMVTTRRPVTWSWKQDSQPHPLQTFPHPLHHPTSIKSQPQPTASPHLLRPVLPVLTSAMIGVTTRGHSRNRCVLVWLCARHLPLFHPMLRLIITPQI